MLGVLLVLFFFSFFFRYRLSHPEEDVNHARWQFSELKKFNVHFQILIIHVKAGLGGSVGCAIRLETRRWRVQPPPRSATFFRGD